MNVELIDTGGLVPGDDPLGLNEQVFLAVEESDVLVLLVDGRQGLVSADEQVWEHFPALRQAHSSWRSTRGTPRRPRSASTSSTAWGPAPMVLISAEHGLGMDDLREALEDRAAAGTAGGAAGSRRGGGGGHRRPSQRGEVLPLEPHRRRGADPRLARRREPPGTPSTPSWNGKGSATC